ncbi:LamG-like jellyroll fold domain-containing protein [Flammeovirgaceae bacterium SG7u.111]|nr:LamG-like jellyroll fold domain-containing protein [Flammeovirgaceae bacterium SG7u.132]WPO34013.1 LamG-like jellyroll fold domain-containing protein [Flammeovirgaceae bacterium SG7u.111]
MFLLFGCKLEETEYIVPRPIAYEPGQVTSTTFEAKWSKIIGYETYWLEVATDESFSNIVDEYSNKEVADTTILVEGLDVNQSYYYRVSAWKAGQGHSNVIGLRTEALSVPQFKSVDFISNTEATIEWHELEGSTSYYIDIATDEGFENLLSSYSSVKVEALELLLSDLQPGETYYFRARGKGAVEFSGYSGVTVIEMPAFDRPVALHPTEYSLTGFVAVWHQLEGAKSYLLDIATDEAFENILPDYSGLSLGDTLLEVKNLEVGQGYFYRVRGVNGKSVSPYSNVVGTKTEAFEAPRALAASDGGLLDFHANWEAVEGASTYLLDVALDKGFSQKLENYTEKEIVGTTALVEGLEVDHTYYYRIRAKRNSSVSGYSNIVEAGTQGFGKPLILGTSDVGLVSFKVTWAEEEGATVYLLDVATDSSFSDFVDGYEAKELASTSETVTELEPQKEYYFRIKAKRDNSYSVYSDTHSAITQELEAPLAVDDGSSSYYKFSARWESVGDADNYILDVSRDAEFTQMLPDFDGKVVGTATSFELNSTNHGVYAGNTYYYRVRTSAKGYTSGYSETIATSLAALPIPDLDAITDVYPPTSSQDLDVHFKFDEASGEYVYNELGTQSGILKDMDLSTCWVTGAVDGALSFDGIDDRINLTDDAAFLKASFRERTIALWVKFFGINESGLIYEEGGATNGMAIGLVNNQIIVTAGDDDEYDYVTSVSLSPDIWYHITAIYDNGEIRLHIDGGDAVSANTDFLKGEISYHGGQPGMGGANGAVIISSLGSEYLHGMVDDLRIYNTPITRDQIKAIMTYGSTLTEGEKAVFSYEIGWDAISNIDGYLIDVATDASFSNILTAYDAKFVDSNNIIVEGLQPNTTYYTRVRAIQGTSISSNSVVQSIHTDI